MSDLASERAVALLRLFCGYLLLFYFRKKIFSKKFSTRSLKRFVINSIPRERDNSLGKQVCVEERRKSLNVNKEIKSSADDFNPFKY